MNTNRNNKKIILVIIVVVLAIWLLSSCSTVRQIRSFDGLEEGTAPTTSYVVDIGTPLVPDVPQGPSVTVVAGCETIDVHVTGLKAGDQLKVGEGAQPPYGVTIGSGVNWQFTVDEAAGTAWLNIPTGLWESTHEFYVTVDINQVRHHEELITCAV